MNIQTEIELPIKNINSLLKPGVVSLSQYFSIWKRSFNDYGINTNPKSDALAIDFTRASSLELTSTQQEQQLQRPYQNLYFSGKPLHKAITSTLLSSLFVLLFPLTLGATHIVGGEMNYTCLGDDNYEISLTVFRDCYNGDPRAWFDDPASIGVFNAENELLFEIQIPLIGNDTLSPILSGECLVVPPDVCVHTTTYRATVQLPPIIGGYQLAYQRCCRNQTIVNIVNPLATGATFGVTISEQALLECNSNPKFKEWPPIYICAGEPIFFDQSAVDMDGDSIVYRLCTPLTGANQQIPQPQPPNPPPYREIEWQDPPYGVENMLNGLPGGEVLKIDPQTGLLTGLPNTIGQFVVGICVEEYRNGTLISTTRRDFQYNVGQCARTVAAFFAPEIYCDGLTVSFDNLSEGSTEYLWLFLQQGVLLDSTLEYSPSYTFPDTGRFEISLIANPDDICNDTFSQEIEIRFPSLQVDFDWQRLSCSDSVQIIAQDQSRDSLSAIVRRKWTLLPYDLTSNQANPGFLAPAAENYTLRLEVEAANGCIQSKTVSFEVDIIETELGKDSLLVCRGKAIDLNPEFDPAYQYVWAENTLIQDTLSPNPVIFPDSSITLTVKIRDSLSFCEVERKVAVYVPPPLDLTLPADTTLCETEWLLRMQSSEKPEAVLWAADREFNQLISEMDRVVVRPRGRQTYYLAAFDAYGCSEVDSVAVLGNGIELVLPEQQEICLGEELRIQAQALDSLDEITWLWELEEAVISGSDTKEPVFLPQKIGPQNILLTTTNQFACRRQDTIPLIVFDALPTDLLIETQVCDNYLVQFQADHPLSQSFVWHFGDSSKPGAFALGASTQHRYPGPGNYELSITTGEGTACPDTLFRTIELDEIAGTLAIDYDVLSCADTALIHFRDNSDLRSEEVVSRQWRVDGMEIADSLSFDWIIRSQDSLAIHLIIAQSNGCVDTLYERIGLPVLDMMLPNTIQACPDEVVSLNPNPPQAYRYHWSPATGLSDPSAANPEVVADSSIFYQLLVSDSTELCSSELGVQLWVAPRYDFSLPEDTVICEPTLTIPAEMSTGGVISWFRQPDFSMLEGRGPSLAVDALEHPNWYARATDFFGCSQTDSIEVISRAVQLGINPESTICIGDTLSITAKPLNDQFLIYDWAPPSEILEGFGTENILVSPPEDTEYQLSVENEFGCMLDTSVLVRIFNYIPPLEIQVDRDTLYVPGEVLLEATDRADYRYFWKPATGLSNPDAATTAVYLEETTTIELIIRDENGCINEAFLTVVVFNPDCIEPNIFVPSAFTPNGDDINDIFIPRGLNIEEMYLIIFDRWGEKVFESNQPDVGWDGTYLGAQLGADVYGYYLEIGCGNGQRFEKKGSVILLR